MPIVGGDGRLWMDQECSSSRLMFARVSEYPFMLSGPKITGLVGLLELETSNIGYLDPLCLLQARVWQGKLTVKVYWVAAVGNFRPCEDAKRFRAVICSALHRGNNQIYTSQRPLLRPRRVLPGPHQYVTCLLGCFQWAWAIILHNLWVSR